MKEWTRTPRFHAGGKVEAMTRLGNVSATGVSDSDSFQSMRTSWLAHDSWWMVLAKGLCIATDDSRLKAK
jgi:hypothetical protein